MYVMGEKQSNICPECTSWMSTKIVNNIEWLYCSQGHHFKVTKRIINIIGNKDDKSKRTK